MKFDPLDANQAVERSNSMPDETPIWIRLQGILGNEGEFAEQFLPVVRNWVKTEVAKTRRGQLDVDDLSQQVLMNVFVRFKDQPFASQNGPGGFHAYLRSCVRNAVIDALRAVDAFYQGKHLDQNQWNEVKASIDGLADQFDTARMKDMAMVRDAVERVRRRVGAVRWEAFYLSVVEGIKGADVATRLNITPSQVYNARCDIAAYLREEMTVLGHKG